jgi:hypothetical protein
MKYGRIFLYVRKFFRKGMLVSSLLRQDKRVACRERGVKPICCLGNLCSNKGCSHGMAVSVYTLIRGTMATPGTRQSSHKCYIQTVPQMLNIHTVWRINVWEAFYTFPHIHYSYVGNSDGQELLGEVKVKLSLYARHEDVWGSGCKDPRILVFSASWWQAPAPVTPWKQSRYPEPIWTTWRGERIYPYRDSTTDPSAVQPVYQLRYHASY